MALSRLLRHIHGSMTDRLCHHRLLMKLCTQSQQPVLSEQFARRPCCLSGSPFCPSLWWLLSSSSSCEGVLHSVLCRWSYNSVFSNNRTSEQGEPYWEPEGWSPIRSWGTFRTTSLQSGPGSCCSWGWEATGSEPASSEPQGCLRCSKAFLSFHGGCWKAGSRNPVLTVPLGTLGY